MMDRDDSLLLQKLARRLIAASTVRHGQRIRVGVNSTGRSLLTPGHNSERSATYPAFWVRDPAWVAESGLIPAEDVWGWVTLIAETMNGPSPRPLASGGIIPPYALADHINMDGRPVFYPGTYASDDTQGPPWGKYPPHDDQYWLTFTAYAYAKLSGDWASFNRIVVTPMGLQPLSRVCELSHNAFPIHPDTQLCVASNDLAEHIVDWGYNDSITKTGKLLFPSLLRLESALKLAAMFDRTGDSGKAKDYRSQAATIRSAIVPAFYEARGADEGWLLSATEIGRKPDVWGSAFAVHRGFVDPPMARTLSQSLLRGFRERTTVRRGQVRHLPTTDGCWEIAQSRPDTYQNGAFWGYPIGWYVCALTQVDENAASALFSEYMAWLRETWTDNLLSCAWECTNPAIDHYQNPGYMTTVALPYATLKAKGLLHDQRS
jgi:hypothetical protein